MADKAGKVLGSKSSGLTPLGCTPILFASTPREINSSRNWVETVTTRCACNNVIFSIASMVREKVNGVPQLRDIQLSEPLYSTINGSFKRRDSSTPQKFPIDER